jgi:hypothetical protein
MLRCYAISCVAKAFVFLDINEIYEDCVPELLLTCQMSKFRYLPNYKPSSVRFMSARAKSTVGGASWPGSTTGSSSILGSIPSC